MLTCLYVCIRHVCLALSKQEQFSSPAHPQGSPSQSGSTQRPSTRNSNTRRLGTPLGLGSSGKLTTVNESNRGTWSNRAGDIAKGNGIDKDTLEPPAGAGAAFNKERSMCMDVDVPRQTRQSSGLSELVRLDFTALLALSRVLCMLHLCSWGNPCLMGLISDFYLLHVSSQGSQEGDHEERGAVTPNRDSNTDTSQSSSVCNCFALIV